MVRGLRGGREEAGESIVYEGRRCTSDKAKANAFIQEYTKISKAESNKEIRKRNVDTARKIRSYEGEEGLSEDFTPKELESAIRKMKTRKAGGPDGIGSDYIKHLTERGKRQALEIFNYSWKEKWVPQQWRTALIIPIRKKGKSQDKVQSFRPIALLSNMGKLMKRLVAA